MATGAQSSLQAPVSITKYEFDYSRKGQEIHKIFKISYEVPREAKQNSFKNIRVISADPLDSSDQARILMILSTQEGSEEEIAKDMTLSINSGLIQFEGVKKGFYRLAKRANFAAMERILNLGIKEDVRSTFLYDAAKDKKEEALRLLLTSPKMNPSVQTKTLLTLVKNADIETVQLFLNCGVNETAMRVALCYYAQNDDQAGLRILLSSPKIDCTILAKVFFFLTKQEDKKAIKALIDAGADKMALTVAIETAIKLGDKNGEKMIADRDVFGAIFEWGESRRSQVSS